ncbi:MAG: nuclear transport factor 2 family protein [Proteobacteria bacterium]|nr:MAG: nuclear transport factor 2 family protein [Pseudomonadota bacterium]
MFEKSEIIEIEKLRVQRALIAITTAAERGDAEKVRSLLTAEVSLDLVGLPCPSVRTSQEICASSHANAAIFGFTAEAISLPEISVQGSRATAISFGHTFHARPIGPARDLWLLHCRYEHELVKVDGRWLIAGINMRPVPREEKAVRRRRSRAALTALAR